MTIDLDGAKTVRSVVGRCPQTRPVFEAHGIDYCCGGDKSLSAAAAEHGLKLPLLLDALEQALQASPGKTPSEQPDWYAAPLGDLVSHIVNVHHSYMKQALPRLRGLVEKVLAAHAAQHGAMLRQVQELFAALDAEISLHLKKEEQVLFPYIVALDAHVRTGAAKPAACFGSVRGPIGQMEHEHQSAGEALAKLRQVTGDYALPTDACPTFAALYEELQRMEADLHQHIHLENNILFPRAGEMEG